MYLVTVMAATKRRRWMVLEVNRRHGTRRWNLSRYMRATMKQEGLALLYLDILEM